VTKDLTEIEKKLAQAAALKIPNVAVNNQAPTAGFQQQKVETPAGQLVVSLVAGDLGSTRVIVDTASDSDCKNDCPVLSLGDYVGRNGAFAGINGSYFCPASYPSCSDKKNSYDLLVMNKNKTYFNSDNNVYSTNPAVIFHGGSVSFVGATSQWGRDTGIDSMLSNFPLLVSGNETRFGGDGDPKKESRGNRSFVANKGNTVYIGVVHGATVAEAAIALKTLGMDNALNLDSGGSTALWANGYKVGPGRAIPNAILFVRK
jgi:exopolysaccharide biosynthesis protein